MSSHETTPGGARPLHRTGRIAWLAGLVIAFSRLALDGYRFARASPTWLFTNLPDDAYFYLEIAQRIARGEGSTIDGIHRTNGYHPLWQGLLSGLALVWHGDALTRAALLLGLFCFAGALLLMALLVRRWLGDLAGAVAAVAGSTIVFPLDNGMEAPVTVLLLAVVAWVLSGYLERPSARRAVLLGLVCGGLVLARVDMAAVVWLVPLVALVVTGRRLAEGRLRHVAARAALMALGGVVAAGPWFGYSWATFGSPLPVSGAVKLFYVDQEITDAFGGRLTAGYARQTVENLKPLIAGSWYRTLPSWWGPARLVLTAAFVLLAALASARWALRRRAGAEQAGDRPSAVREPALVRRSRVTAVALVTLAVVTGLQLLISVVVIPGDWIELWYKDPLYLWVAVLAGGGSVWLLRTAVPSRPVALVACFALLAAWSFGRLGLVSGTQVPSSQVSSVVNGAHDEAAHWVAAHGPAGIYATYSSGYAAFVADPTPMVNMDGLANSYELLRLLREGSSQLQLYRWSGARYLITEEAFDRVPACARQIWRAGGSIRIPPDPATGQKGAEVPLGVFDLAPCGLPGGSD